MRMSSRGCLAGLVLLMACEVTPTKSTPVATRVTVYTATPADLPAISTEKALRTFWTDHRNFYSNLKKLGSAPLSIWVYSTDMEDRSPSHWIQYSPANSVMAGNLDHSTRCAKLMLIIQRRMQGHMSPADLAAERAFGVIAQSWSRTASRRAAQDKIYEWEYELK